MKSVLLCLLIVCSIFTATNGHALLQVPKPWNPAASMAAPCSGSPNTTPQITYCPGSKANIIWNVQVGDGVGPVTFKLSTSHDQTKFDTTLTSTGATPDKTGPFSFQVDIPNVACQDNLCYLQAFSDSKWFSCASINIAADCNAVQTALVPEEVEDLQFCTMVNKRTVLVPVGSTETTIKAADDATLATFKANMANPAVIGTNTTTCGNYLAEMMCDQAFPLAPGSDGVQVTNVCSETCNDFKEVCGVVAHSALFPCENYPKCSSAFKQLPSLFILFFIVVIALLF